MANRKLTERKERTSDLGKFLTKKRKQNNLTQEEVAQKIGRTKDFICRIETAERTFNWLYGAILLDIAYAYEVSQKEVFEYAGFPQLPLMKEEEIKKLIYIKRRFKKIS